MRRGRFDPLVYQDPLPSPALIRALGPVNRHLVLPHVLKLSTIDLPRADFERLRAAVRPGTAAFIGPNHPEFMTDWMLDKEISRRVSPLMAHWASYEIVNLNPWVQWLWLRNNLIANAPGGGGKDYSVRWALAGHGVLLHPEGTASWHGDDVGPLVPGIADMAWETCRRAGAGEAQVPVYIVPIVWKLHFSADVSAGLHREMGHIERRLRLPSGVELTIEARFAALQKRMLRRRCERFGFAQQAGADIPDHAFFEVQEAFAARLLSDLESRHGRFEGDVWRRVHGLRRAIRERAGVDPEGARHDRRRLHEIERLHRFTREVYGRPTLTQEQIAENLKQIRSALLTRGLRESLHNLVPVAVAPRIAHIRAPEPIAVHEVFARGGDEAGTKAALLQSLRERLQAGLDALNVEIAPPVDRYRRPNPFHTGARAVS